MSNKTSVAIIGTAGRGRDGMRMNKELFSKMVDKAVHIIRDVLKLSFDSIRLVSGGAAWSGL
jgi:hypothetical protein